MSANRYVPGFASTTARSSKRAKEFGFCPSFCPPKVPGSTPSSRSGCMPRRLLWNPMVCSRLSSWLNAFVLTLAAPMNPLFPLSKRLRDYALERQIFERRREGDVRFQDRGDWAWRSRPVVGDHQGEMHNGETDP